MSSLGWIFSVDSGVLLALCCLLHRAISLDWRLVVFTIKEKLILKPGAHKAFHCTGVG